MDLLHALAELKAAALARIVEAARAGDSATIHALADTVGEIEADLKAAREIETRRARYARELNGVRVNGDRASVPDLRGPDPRMRFLEFADKAGSPLVEMGRTLYRTASGKTVAVPVANEARPGRWLLSVEDMRYGFVALVCQPVEGELHAFVLPWRVLEPVWKALSRNGRQVKLTVAKKADGWWLQVPGGDGLRIDPFLDGYAALGAEPVGAL
jgi:hypothetical protein